jgi:predicted Ser/Thr protein kinase
MKWMSDEAVTRLQQALDRPDFTGTRYRLIREIARGGMGAVYLAEDTELERKVAVKVVHATDSSEDAAARMLREARIMAQLEHPGIVPVHDAGPLPDGRVFYAMKFVDGRPLAQHPSDMSLAESLRLFQKICDAVAFAHSRGVVHRDLKPENIMAGAFGEVLVMDWGAAALLDGPGEPPGAVIGTPGYMSPEQASGQAGVDARADVYALGAILAFLVRDRARVPAALESICRKALTHDRDQRYSSALELRADIASFLDAMPVSAHEETVVERLIRVAARHRTALLLILAYLVMRTLIFLWARR